MDYDTVAAQNAELARLKILAPVLLTISAITVALRIFTRTIILHNLSPDDWAMVTALTIFASYVGLFYNTIHVQTELFAGNPDFTFAEVILRAKWINGTYALCVLAVKLSVAIFMRRLYGVNHVWQRWTIMVSTGLLTAMGIVFFVMSVASCGVGSRSNADCPVNSAYTAISYTWSLMNTLVDVLFAAMSILLVMTISIKGVAAFSTGVLLVIGTIGGVASALRCAVILGWHGDDQAVTNLVIGRWSMLEAGLTIIAASLATLRPLLKKIQGVTTDSYGTTQAHEMSKTNKSRRTVQDVDETPLFGAGQDKANNVTVAYVETAR